MVLLTINQLNTGFKKNTKKFIQTLSRTHTPFSDITHKPPTTLLTLFYHSAVAETLQWSNFMRYCIIAYH